jgi:excisionase family DNA binding protein
MKLRGLPASPFPLKREEVRVRRVLYMSTNLPTLPRLFEIPEVCETLRICRTTLHRMVKEKKIECTRIGKRVLFTVEQIEDCLSKLNKRK